MAPRDDPNPRSLRHASASAMWTAVRALLRTRIMAGVLTVLPIWVTWAVVKFVFNMMRGATEPLAAWVAETSAKDPRSPIPAFLKPWLGTPEEGGSGPLVPVIAVLLTLFFLYLLGFCTAHLFGRRVLEGLERLVDRVPIAKTVYRLTKQVVTTMAGETEMSRGRVVLVEVYRPGLKCVGFLTSVIKEKETGRELCTVFIPSTPNPAVGYTHIVPREQVQETGWTMEKAVKLVVSGGAAASSEVVWSGGTAGPDPAVPTAGRERPPAPDRSGQ